ncbi:MAG: hypothetical protein KGL39_32395 [Patescibacteria group bacterium]|nr:hypothetical protein [Patescibacteria group bacterium]
MTHAQKLMLASHLLDMASNAYSNRGCNDFDLSELIPSAVDRESLMNDLSEWAHDPDMPRQTTMTMDWMLMGYLADWLKSQAGSA